MKAKLNLIPRSIYIAAVYYCLAIALTLFSSAFSFVDVPVKNVEKVKAFPKDQTKDWEILFDGKSMHKWRGITDSCIPVIGWKIENGLLFTEGKGNDIVTKEIYSSFELVFEFNLTEGANSGIKYFVDTLINQETKNVTINGPEYQIIDDFNHPAVKDDPNGLNSTASAYLLYAPVNKKLNPHGTWNTGRIVAKNNKVEHWLNGIKVLSYTRGSKDFLKQKAKTKFKNDINYGELDCGHILLTDHHDKVFFRNIKIRRL